MTEQVDEYMMTASEEYRQLVEKKLGRRRVNIGRVTIDQIEEIMTDKEDGGKPHFWSKRLEKSKLSKAQSKRGADRKLAEKKEAGARGEGGEAPARKRWTEKLTGESSQHCTTTRGHETLQRTQRMLAGMRLRRMVAYKSGRIGGQRALQHQQLCLMRQRSL